MICYKCLGEISESENNCKYCGTAVLRAKNIEYSQEIIDLHLLGYYYYSGENNYPQDINKALHYFTQAAQNGCLDSLNFIGALYLDGDGVPCDIEYAERCFESALNIDPGYGKAAFNLGLINHLMKDGEMHQKALEYFAISINYFDNEEYYAQACCYIGNILLACLDQPSQSVDWFCRALVADCDIAEAWHNLGYLCELGEYCPDGYNPFHFYKEAAALGLGASMDAIGRLFGVCCSNTQNEYEKERFVNLACNWCELAIEAGYEPAKKRLKAFKIAQISMRIAGFFTYSRDELFTQSFGDSVSARDAFSSNVKKDVVFRDGGGNYAVSGGCFVDGRGNLCEWGNPFYDARGNYCTWGSPFYDWRGNYCSWGSPFYDSQGNYIAP